MYMYGEAEAALWDSWLPINIYTRRPIDGMLGEVIAGSSLHTTMEKKHSDVNLSTSLFI